MISVQIIKDSISDAGIRLTTFALKYPRFIHSELMTHRVFSRNASSSRAIPLKTQIQMLLDDIAYPEDWRYNQSGMQGFIKCSNEDIKQARAIWFNAAQSAIDHALLLGNLNIHKQTINRLLEPFAYIQVVLTSTDFANFFALRTDEGAQPEMQILAGLMYENYLNNTPEYLKPGQWHLPFMDCPPDYYYPDEEIKRSVARCARVSYLKHDKTEATLEEDLKLYNRLLGGEIKHVSPAEHQAMAMNNSSFRSGNFRGWIQYRKTLKDENIRKFKELNEIS